MWCDTSFRYMSCTLHFTGDAKNVTKSQSSQNLVNTRSHSWISNRPFTELKTSKSLCKCYDLRILSCFCLWFCTFIIFHHPACLVYYYCYSFTHPASSHALVFPSHVSVFLSDLSPSTYKSISSHSLVISGFLVFSNRFLHISFSEVFLLLH